MNLTDSEFENLLREEFEPREPRPLPESQPAPPRRRRAIWAAAIAAAAVLAILIPAKTLRSTPAVLEDAEGSRKIQYGEVVRPSGDASALLAMADGARVEMRSQSELLLERADADGVRVVLNKGSVIVDSAGQHSRNLYVQTKELTASVAGTVSFVKAEAQGSQLAAIGGAVRVQQGTTEINLRPGEQLSTNPLMELLPVREQISWSRNAEAHAALLPQAAVPSLPAFPSPESRAGEGRTLIKEAGEGHLQTVRLLLDRGADANLSVPGAGSPLIAAAREGRLEVVRLLLDRSADPNLPVPGDGSPLIAAAGEGRVDVVALLLDRGARIEEVVPGDENALITASGEGRLNVVQLLVSRGANVNARVWAGSTGPRSSGEWRTPLSQAAREGRGEVVQFLLSSGAKE